MNILLAILSLLLLGLTYLLLAPFYLEINSITNTYRIRFHGWAWARLFSSGGIIFIEFKVFWWRRVLDIRSMRGKSAKRDVKSSRRKAIPIHRVLSVLKSFKISRCYGSFDTGDEALNGVLYPLFHWMSLRTGKDLSINFCDQNEIDFQIRNNFFRVILAYARS